MAGHEYGRGQRYWLMGSLYVSQAIPLGFFIVALPAILRQRGASLEHVGLLSALALPWMIKFMWAPLLDRFGSRRLGHYRSWILPLQSLSVVCVLILATLDVTRNLWPMVMAGGVFMLLAATQDIATDGLAVRLLGPAERGPGNGIQVGGYYLGQILGGGAALVIFQHFGWTATLLTLAGLLALPLIPTLRFREGSPVNTDRPDRVDYRALGRFFARPGASLWIPIVLLFRVGETMALTMFNPLLVDLGHSLEQIGILIGVASSVASLSGAVLGGVLVTRLGRRRSLAQFLALEGISLGGFVLLASGMPSMPAIYAVAMLAAFTGGMATAALYTHMMDRCSPTTGATDFTLQQSLAAIGPLLGAGASGFLAANLGYTAHFALCAATSLGCAALILWGLAGDVYETDVSGTPSRATEATPASPSRFGDR